MARKWARLRPPLRPNAEVADAVRAELAPLDGPTLLLGVTPELATIATPLIAVDRNPGMIACAWPGNGVGRNAVQGDWLAMPIAGGRIANAVGDGSFNTLAYPDGYVQLFDQLAKVLKPEGRIVARTFATPEEGETLDAVRAATMSGRIASLHAFKWRLAMAVVAQSGSANIRVTRIRDAFHALFPDQAALMAATGWAVDEIDTIEVYKDSVVSFSFPRLSELLAIVPAGFRHLRVLSAGSYELVERCPIVVMERE
jgi:SAM-dependent methyltransferase